MTLLAPARRGFLWLAAAFSTPHQHPHRRAARALVTCTSGSKSFSTTISARSPTSESTSTTTTSLFFQPNTAIRNGSPLRSFSTRSKVPLDKSKIPLDADIAENLDDDEDYDYDDEDEFEAAAEEEFDERLKKKQQHRQKKKKRPSKLQRQALRRANGPDPYDNPVARKIRQWAVVEKQIAAAERDTMRWVRRCVVGLNLCPFAERAVADENGFKIRVVLDSDMTGTDTIVDIVVQEMEALVQRNRGTTLVVCPNLYKENFEGFLQILDVVEQNLEANGFRDILQVAPFHPRFVFAESQKVNDAPDNYTNRAPHPTFHLLREADVSRAVDCLPEEPGAAAVWARNVDLLRELHATLSPDDFRAVVTSQERSASLQQTVREAVRRHRVSLVKPNQSSGIENDGLTVKNDTEPSEATATKDSDDDEGSIVKPTESKQQAAVEEFSEKEEKTKDV